MAQTRGVTDWDADSFRFIFPMYQSGYPSIYYSHYHKKKGWIARKLYCYAHNDIAQSHAGYNAVGSGFLVLMLICSLWERFRGRLGNSFGFLLLLIGLGAFLPMLSSTLFSTHQRIGVHLLASL
jgi:hypothetical protein